LVGLLALGLISHGQLTKGGIQEMENPSCPISSIDSLGPQLLLNVAMAQVSIVQVQMTSSKNKKCSTSQFFPEAEN